ncbi:MAG: hypothetical protein JNK65_02085 [Deltaproteobacteria bacterium]|nr:hypothetical protein [Deltaproteobacteria bacterium]
MVAICFWKRYPEIMKAIELIASINEKGHLVHSQALPFKKESVVKVIILSSDDPDNSVEDEISWIKFASQNEVLDFLKDPQEDIYSLSDGKSLAILRTL